jgi:Flp pilus assembly protein TadD
MEGEAACRKAIALQPDFARAYSNLGLALYRQGKPVEAEAAYIKAIAIKPNDGTVYYSLGLALYGQEKYAAAETAYRKVIALKPDYAEAYNNLGVALRRQGKNVEAETAYRKAIALKPDYAEAHYNLGNALDDQEKHAEAEAAYQRAIALKPDYAEAYNNLGLALHAQGRFTESLAAFRRGHELRSKQAGWSHPSREWVRAVERMVELEKKLPALFQGKASPANARDAIDLARMCRQFKKRHVAAARLYSDAIAAEPKLTADLEQQHRYNAACSAALAAAGEGEDARRLPDKVVTMFRRWALVWLRDDLTACAKLAERNDPAVKQTIQQQLAQWRRVPDLASVRDQPALDRLPENERTAWQKLWRDVDELAKRLAKKDEPTKERKKPETRKTRPEGRSSPTAGATGR